MRWAAGLAVLALLPSCSASKGIGEGENTEATKAALATLAAPLEISGFQVVNADGNRTVFFKLSRLPDSVTSYSESDPARIVMEVKGPTGQEVPEQFFPGNDPYVTYVRITVSYGIVRVVMDLNAAAAPAYTVQPMADWIMVRLGTTQASAPSPVRAADGEGRGGGLSQLADRGLVSSQGSPSFPAILPVAR